MLERLLTPKEINACRRFAKEVLNIPKPVRGCEFEMIIHHPYVNMVDTEDSRILSSICSGVGEEIKASLNNRRDENVITR